MVFCQTITLGQAIAPATDGTGTAVNQTGNSYNITGGQRSGDGANLFHSFQEFGLNAGQTANFISAPEINNILGRVTGGNASIINGLIQITGGNSNLFLINPAGLIFGPNATLNIPGDFTATTATGIGFNAGWFNAFGNNNYSALIGEPSAFAFSISQPGSILQSGNLILNPEQNLTLLGGTVVNLGSLTSPGGNITIAAVPGENLVRINQENHLLSLELPLCATANCNNSGNQPPQNFQPLDLPSLLTGGQITHASHVTVNNDGTISLTGSTSRIPTDPGVAVASGNIDVSNTSTNSPATGGTVAVLGDKVALVDTNINANGTNGGGTVLVGGEYQGQGEVPNASNTFVNKNSLISANATENGDGGQVIIWADETTRFHGEISAQGGNQNGDGGLVEVSGKKNLIFRGDVDTSAPEGSTGSLLLDPDNITIANGSGGADDAEVTGDGSIFGSDGTGDFTISETALEGLTNTDISLEATNNITIDDLSDNLLSLKTATGGSVTFSSDSDYSGTGDFSMNPSDTIQTQGGAVNISRNQVTLGNIITNGGDITVDGTNAIFNGNISTNGGDFFAAGTNATVKGNINAGSGSIEFLFYSGGITIGSVTFTADQLSIDGTISASQPGTDSLIVEPGTSDRTIEITDDYMCSGTTLCLGLDPFNAIQAAGFNSIKIGRSDGTGKINMGGHSAVATIGSPTTIQAGTGTITVTDQLNAQGNPLTLIADEIDVNSTISGTGSLTLQPSTVSQNIALGGTADAGAGSLDLTSTDFELINGFSSLTIGRSNGTGTINTAGLVDFSPKTFDVTLNGGQLTFNNPMILRNNGILTLNNGSITSPGTGTDVTIGGTGNLILNISGNVGESLNPLMTNVPNVTISNISGNLFINNGQALDLGAVNIPGNLGITASGNITDSGVVSVAGNSTFTTTEPDATITLDQLSSTGSISVNTTGSNGNATVTNSTAVNLAASQVGGNLNVTATTGNITSSGTVTVGGNSSFTTSASGADITLDKLANPGTITVNTNGSGADATIANSTAVNLAASSVGGGLNVTATTGNITDSGTVTVGGNRTFTTSQTDADITLDQLSGTGSISMNTTGAGGDANLANPTAVNLATSTVGGNLNVTATTGNITSSGTVTVGGNSSFTTSAIGADITLDKLANPGTITVNTNGSGADAAIANSSAVNLAASSVGGGLNVTATTGGISTSGNITAGSDITLTGKEIALNNSVTSGGSLNATANNGEISNSGVINAATDITLTGDAIALNNSLSSPGNIILKPLNNNTTIALGGETGTFNLSAAEIANLSDGFSSITIGRSDGTGTANVGSISFSDPVKIQSGTGELTVNGDITGTDNASVTLNSSNIALNAGINTNSQNITIGGNTIIGSNITLDTGTGTGNIAFNGTVDGNQDLTLNAGTGSVSFAGAVGATTALNTLTVNSGISSGITATANNIAIAGDVLSNGADVTLTAENQLTTNNITTSGGAINLTNNNGDVTSANLNSSNPSGAGGGITVNSSTGVATTGNLTSTGTTGGNITVQALTSITTGDINSSGTVGNGGNVLLDPENDIQVGFINAQGGASGIGGNVNIITGKFFRAIKTFTDQNGQVASISTAGGTGGGNITLTHDGGNQNTPFVVGNASINGTAGVINTGASTMPSGSSFPGPTQQGNIQLITAEPPVTPEPGTTPTTPGTSPTTPGTSPTTPGTSPTTPGTSTGQPGLPVAAAPTDNAMVSPQLDSEPTPTNARIPVAPANPAVTGPLAIQVPAIAPETPVAPGAIAPEPAAVPSATPASATPATQAGTAVSSPVISESSSVTPVSTEISTPSTPPAPPPEVPVASSISVAVPGSVAENGGDRVLSSTSQVLLPQETTAIATNLETASATELKPENIRDRQLEAILGDQTEDSAMFDFGVAEIEAIFTQAFQIHLELSEVIRSLGIREAQTIIRRIDAETGVKPALLYVRFSPTSIEGTTDNDPLELLFVAPDGRPSRKVLSVTRGEVIATAENLNTYITAPRYRRRTSYLEPAQQLHQWLIAPVQKELDNHAIQNLVLIMDSGLRSLPVAALHDGEHFLVEKYSLGMMPSLSLTDPRYRSIQNTSVLAMGASQFSDLNPLPAVPAEVQTITQLRQGSFFLNEEFTLNNIQQQYAEKQPPIVHLATHGEFEPGDISHSYIQLWDQKLRLNDIRQLGFQDPAVELLVLSACQTAVGNEQAELGFAGMAVKAGVKTALASLWYVSDEGTFGLMTEFYKALETAPIKAEAIRQAQLSMINGNVEVVDGQLRGSRGSYPLPEALQNVENQKLTHPYYWSAFTLIGSPW
ncbi:CHAT domain-containing protein [Planktothricoides raciborskii]|uniref:CHAT domain-containing protein n=1 Tax=Planktothricoides raciborskii GIHE-MW2 TaxID=2792601 RepID=A0AAU8JEX5_9CYAN